MPTRHALGAWEKELMNSSKVLTPETIDKQMPSHPHIRSVCLMTQRIRGERISLGVMKCTCWDFVGSIFRNNV